MIIDKQLFSITVTAYHIIGGNSRGEIPIFNREVFPAELKQSLP
jgi:hypothetical protein